MGRVQVRYKCQECGEEFDSELPDAVAQARYEEDYHQPFNPETAAVVCEDCYQIIVEDRILKHPVN